MKNYFVRSNEKEHTCYYEFYQGKYIQGQPLWHKDSICMEDIDFEGSKFYKIIKEVEPNFDNFGETPITKQQWEEIEKRALGADEETVKIIKEMQDWAQENFKKYDCFTIFGL